ncbi:MAG: site-2 protease family protein, partial [Candidatus Methanoplasma sp.]|nr:site-2 protease family protein [Candidatus Methanoplasma sp.]
MELSYLVLLILTIFYIPFYIWVRKSPKAAKHGLVKYGPTVMLKTRSGTKLMDRLSVYRRFWRAFGILSIAISFVLMLFIILIIAVGVINLTSNLTSPGIGIEYALAIPGLNPLLPIWYGWLGLIVAMVVHELAHGMQTRANDMRVDSTGVLYGVVPLGAFVEPNEEDIKNSTRRAKLDLYSAGVSTNFIAAAAAFFIFAVLMLGNVSSVYGDSAAVYQVTSGSPA